MRYSVTTHISEVKQRCRHIIVSRHITAAFAWLLPSNLNPNRSALKPISTLYKLLNSSTIPQMLLSWWCAQCKDSVCYFGDILCKYGKYIVHEKITIPIKPLSTKWHTQMTTMCDLQPMLSKLLNRPRQKLGCPSAKKNSATTLNIWQSCNRMSSTTKSLEYIFHLQCYGNFSLFKISCNTEK